MKTVACHSGCKREFKVPDNHKNDVEYCPYCGGTEIWIEL